MVETREEWEAQLSQIVEEARRPVEFRIHEMYKLYSGQGRAKVGSFKRKAKGREYVSPRILLRGYFKKHIGKRCEVFEGRGSIEGTLFQNCDILVMFLINGGNE